MKNTKAILTAAIIAFSAINAAHSETVLRVSSSAASDPISFQNPQTKEWSGFMPDVLRLITAGMDFKLEFIDSSVADRLSLFRDKKIDTAAASYTPTAEREIYSDFSKPVGMAREAVLMTISNNKVFNSQADFKGVEIYTPNGAGWQASLEKIGAVVKTVRSSGDLHGLVLKDPSVIAVTTLGGARLHVKNNPNALKVVTSYPAFAITTFNLPVGKGNKVLLDKFNASIEKHMKDGSLRKLQEKYGIEPPK